MQPLPLRLLLKLKESGCTDVWTRDFASEEQREELYKKVYGSDYWTNEVAPLVPECIDPEGILVERIVPCDDFPEGVSAAGAPCVF
eukprot:COSAG04_NODE_2506_length_3995_cov_1.565708_7_plen_86_part_00